ncbi:MAG: NTP transferase domain-containing protein [Hyphomonadaceae bacterium]|nr:NTP transferase domain-containing protein [Hyphomonadaceae bacterium]
MTVIGCVFAGGKGRRLGGRDKAQLMLDGVPLWQRVIHRLESMVDQLIVTGPTRPDWALEGSRYRFVADIQVNGEPVGPAGGLLAALEWGLDQAGPETRVLTVPVDAPFYPVDLYAGLAAGQGAAPVALVEAGARLQPAFGLWSCAVAQDVRKYVEDGNFALHAIARQTGAATVRFDVKDEAFLNINTPEDLARAESLAARK